MEECIILLKIIALALTAFYLALLFVYLVSWEKIKEFNASAAENKTFLSVIVAARNEEKNIRQCLDHLSQQTYPLRLFEIIVVNDFSDDGTQQVVESFFKSNKEIQMRVINLHEIILGRQGSKKEAITKAVKVAKGELVITTDADCTMNKNWMKTIADYYEKHSPYLISAPVVFSDRIISFPFPRSWRGSLFNKIQSLEFISLIGSGAAAIQSGFPLMCNASNLAFKKNIYFEAGRDDVNNEPQSGDDTFLMFAIHKKFPGKISFLKSKDAIITTHSQPSLNEFFNQRKRWISKVKNYSGYYVKGIGLLVFLFNLTILFTGIASLFYKTFFTVFLIQVCTKLIIDFGFLFQITGFFKKRKLLLLFFPVQVLHIFYIVIISLVTFSGTYEWKKRRIKM